jgi:hypothetical protein
VLPDNVDRLNVSELLDEARAELGRDTGVLAREEAWVL